MTMLLLDMAPIGGGIALFAGVAFFLVAAGLAAVVFKLLRRSVKLAMRIAIVAAILMAAVIGTVSFYFWSSSGPATRPAPRRQR